MTMTLPADDPIAVWDTRDADSLFWRNWQETHRWAMVHIQDANETYRAEFYLYDLPFAVVYRWQVDGDGNLVVLANEPVVLPPAIQVLAELPPGHLLGIVR